MRVYCKLPNTVLVSQYMFQCKIPLNGDAFGETTVIRGNRIADVYSFS